MNKIFIAETAIDAVNVGLWALGGLTATVGSASFVVDKVKKHQLKKAAKSAAEMMENGNLTREQFVKASKEFAKCIQHYELSPDQLMSEKVRQQLIIAEQILSSEMANKIVEQMMENEDK